MPGLGSEAQVRTVIELCLEMTPEHGGVAHVFELPGLQFRADTREEFLTRGGVEAGRYLEWCDRHRLGDLNAQVKAIRRASRRGEGGTGPALHSRVVESLPGQPVWQCESHAALFEKDRAPLTDDDVRAHIRVVRAAYIDMARALTGLAPADFAHRPHPEARTLEEALAHLTDGAWWFCSRLSDTLAEPGTDVPPAGLDRLKFLLAFAERWFLEFPAERRAELIFPARRAVGGPGEPWCHHKAVRRHTEHLYQHLPSILQASRLLRSDSDDPRPVNDTSTV